MRGRNQNTGEIKPEGDKPGKETDMNNFEFKGKRGSKRKKHGRGGKR